jgi:hypothetical protein
MDADLSQRVRELIAEGWQPLNGISVSMAATMQGSNNYQQETWIFAQAMVKYAD